MNTHNYLESIGAISKDTGIRSYVTGFLASLILTFAAYFLAVSHALSYGALVGTLLVFALLQFGAQVIFFLHLLGKGAARERLLILAMAVLIVFILVAGSLWIMTNLNGRMMAPETPAMMQYMQSQSGL
jgi:cytochrome o ubiquinol oxidase subunit IV